jgi:hypothetical protein
MVVSICLAASRTVLLVHPKHGSNGLVRSKTEGFDQPHRLPGNKHTSSIVHGAISNVLAIGVAAEDDELVQVLGTCNQVSGWHVQESVSLEVELDFHALATSLHASEHLRVFWSDGHSRDAGYMSGACVRGLDAVHCDFDRTAKGVAHYFRV